MFIQLKISQPSEEARDQYYARLMSEKVKTEEAANAVLATRGRWLAFWVICATVGLVAAFVFNFLAPDSDVKSGFHTAFAWSLIIGMVGTASTLALLFETSYATPLSERKKPV